jgi:glutamine synthetase
MAPAEPLIAADNLFLFRELCREIAREFQCHITFLGRPIVEAEGSGLHVNISLHDETGTNLLGSPPALSAVARQFIAGCLAHHSGLAAICAPTVNSYKRLRPGFLSGYSASWGYEHRYGVIRVPRPSGRSTRLEHRMTDASASPYLACAAILHAGRMGVVNHLVCPEPATALHAESADYTQAPRDLCEAIRELRNDLELRTSIGDSIVTHFLSVKDAEWSSFANALTDWERRTYFPVL